MPRPRKDRKLGFVINVRVSSEEKDVIDRFARDTGASSQSDAVRAMIRVLSTMYASQK